MRFILLIILLMTIQSSIQAQNKTESRKALRHVVMFKFVDTISPENLLRCRGK